MLRSGRDRYEHLWAARSLRSHRRRGRRAQDGIGADTPFEGLIFPLQRCLPAMAIGCPKAAAVAECHVRCAAARTQAIWAAGFERHVAEVNSCCEKAGADSKECDNATHGVLSPSPVSATAARGRGAGGEGGLLLLASPAGPAEECPGAAYVGLFGASST